MVPKQNLKRWFISGVIASLVLSALIGIFVIIQGSFDEMSLRILATTLVIGLYSITGLASLRTLESENAAARSFSRISILFSAIALVLDVIIIWLPDVSEGLGKAASVFGIIAVSSAHACLLLPFAKHSRNLRSIVTFTLTFIAAVAAILIYLSLGDLGSLFMEGDGQIFRVLAVFAILDVLGTVVTPISAKFLVRTEAQAPITNIVTPDKPQDTISE